MQTESKKLKGFFEFWLDCPVPLVVVRTEELLSSPQNVVEQIGKFILGRNTLEGTRLGYTLNLNIPTAPEEYLPPECDEIFIQSKFGSLDSAQVTAEVNKEMNEIYRKIGENGDKIAILNRENIELTKELNLKIEEAALAASFVCTRVGEFGN